MKTKFKIFTVVALLFLISFTFGIVKVNATENLELDLTCYNPVELDLNDTSNSLVSALENLITSNTTGYLKVEDGGLVDAYAYDCPEIKVTYNSGNNKATLQLNCSEPQDGAVVKTVSVNGVSIDIKYGYVVTEVDEIVINNANFDLKDGLVPTIKSDPNTIFKATSSDSSYFVYVESWSSRADGKSFSSSEYFNNDGHTNGGKTLLTKFEAGKNYTYGIWIKPAEGYKFTDNVKLKLNGQTYTYDYSRDGENDDAGVYFYPLSVTIENNSNSTSNTPTNLSNIKNDINVWYYSNETGSVNMKQKATLKVGEGLNIISVASLEYDLALEEVKPISGYDAQGGIFLTMIKLDIALSKDIEGTLTIPVPDGYSNSTVKIKIGDKEYNSVSYSSGFATFVLPLKYTVVFDDPEWDIFGNVYFQKGSNTQTSSSISVVEDNKELVTTGDEVTTESTVLVTSSDSVSAELTAEKPLPENCTLDVKEVEISKELKKAEKNLKKIFDISVLDVNGSVVKVEDNKLKITLSIDKDLQGYNTYKVVYINDEGKIAETLPATVKDGKLTFTTSHLSQYGVVAYNSSNSVKTGDGIVTYVVLLVVATVGVAVIGIKKFKLKSKLQ